MSEPNWIIIIIISGIFGYCVQYIIKLPLFICRHFKHDDLHGKWYNYFYCESDNNHNLHEAVCSIKTGLFHTYKVENQYHNIIYKGYGYIEHNHLCILYICNDKLSKETVNLRFQLPTATNRDKLLGIWLSYDFNDKVSSGISILSKYTLNDIQLHKIIATIKATNTNIII